jgi:hypothetical protein
MRRALNQNGDIVSPKTKQNGPFRCVYCGKSVFKSGAEFVHSSKTKCVLGNSETKAVYRAKTEFQRDCGVETSRDVRIKHGSMSACIDHVVETEAGRLAVMWIRDIDVRSMYSITMVLANLGYIPFWCMPSYLERPSAANWARFASYGNLFTYCSGSMVNVSNKYKQDTVVDLFNLAVSERKALKGTKYWIPKCKILIPKV